MIETRDEAEAAERAATAALAEELRTRGVGDARVALVLGSGLGVFAERLAGARAIPYAELEGMPKSAVPGHAGQLVTGTVRGVQVVVQQGRVHLYEGWSAFEVTRAVRAFAELGIGALVLTNAAGGLRPEWTPGTLMRVSDHLALQGASPLFAGERGARQIYSAEAAGALDAAAAEAGVQLECGVYVGLLGPTYETPAEVDMLRWMGADAVGMSTVAEAAVGAANGMRVAAVSCVTNPAAGISPTPLNHDEVVEAGRAAADRFCALLEAAVPRLS